MRSIVAGSQYRREIIARGEMNVVQEALLFRRTMPASCTVIRRPSVSVKAAMSIALPKACSKLPSRN